MTPEMALGAVKFLASSIDQESKTTRKVLAAVPAGQEGFHPYDGKSMSALDLSWHLASSEVWFLNCIADGAFGQPEPTLKDNIKTVADVVAYYDKEHTAAMAKIHAMDGDAAAKILDFMGMMQMPAVVFLQLAANHAIHHRGQLSVYLRPMGAKVPSIYGPSGDDDLGMKK